MSDADDEIKKAEQRGYSRGYSAGQKRVQREDERERLHQERQALLDRMFIAVLPAAMDATGWKFGDAPINSTADRVKLAAIFAKEAFKQRPGP